MTVSERDKKFDYDYEKRARARFLGMGLLLLMLALTHPAAAQVRRAEPSPSPAATPKTALDNSAPCNVELDFGFASYQAAIKPDYWCPVWATIEARKGDITGRVIVQQPRNALQITIPFQVAKGSKKRYLSYYRFDPRQMAQVEVSIRLGMFDHDGFTQQLRFSDDGEQHILVLPDEPGGLGMIARAGIEAAQQPADSGEGNPNLPPPMRTIRRQTGPYIGGTRVIYGTPEQLPDDPIALESLDGMIINTARVRALTPRQWEAVRTWVMSGGRLLLAGGRQQPFIEQSVLKGAFGLTLGAAQPVAASAVFAGGETSATLLASWPAGAWTRIALGDAAHPLLVSKRVGRGWFHLCAAALDEPLLKLIEQKTDIARFWPGLLERHFMQTPLQRIADQGEGAIGQELQRPFGFNLVGAGWVFIFLGSYILLALPLTWFICGRLKRHEWAWPAAIVLALGYAWYGYSSGLRSQSSVFQVNEVTLVTQAPGAPTARAATFSSIFSPRRYSTNLEAPAGLFANRMTNYIPGSYYYNQEDLYADRALTLAFQPASVFLGDLFFHPWSARNLRSDFTVAMKGGITLEATTATTRSDALLSGRITNHTQWTFSEWWITYGSQAWPAQGPFAPNATLDLTQEVVYKPRNKPTGSINVIVRDAIKDAIIEPALRENVATRAQQDQYSGSPSNSYWLNNQSLVTNADELFFIGRVDTSLSPLTEPMRLERRRGVMLYEAALSQPERKERPQLWRPALLDPGAAYRANYYGGQNVSVSDAGVILRPQTTDIQFIPDRPVDIATAGSLTFAFRVANSPSEKQLFTPTQTQRTSNGGYNQYRVAGCPVQVYNLRLKRWEPAPIAEQGRHTVAPLRDYLNPATSALTLRIDAEPEKLLFREGSNDPNASDQDSKTMTGKQLWGNELQNFRYNYNSGFVYNIQLMDISVTLGDASTSSRERSAQ